MRLAAHLFSHFLQECLRDMSPGIEPAKRSHVKHPTQKFARREAPFEDDLASRSGERAQFVGRKIQITSICGKVHLPSNVRFLPEKRGLQKISVSFHLDWHGSLVFTESAHTNRPRT